MALTVVASVALFALIQTCRPYVAMVEGEFYTPILNSRDTLLDRAFSRVALATLRQALWPVVAFIVLEGGATCSFSVDTLGRPLR